MDRHFGEGTDTLRGLLIRKDGGFGARGRRVDFSPGETIFREGDEGDGFYVVVEGEVELSAVGPDGGRRAYCRMGGGDVFGFMAPLDSTSRGACATATLPTRTVFVTREELWDEFPRSPQLMLALFRELSDRLKESNRRYVEALMQAERMAFANSFASAIVHDLKGPLTVINLATDELVSPDSSEEARREGAEGIFRAVGRLTSMVHRVLEFTRDAGEARMELREVRFSSFMDSLAADMRKELSFMGARLRLLNEPPALTLRIDPERLASVFENLLVNAAQMRPRSGEIDLRFEAEGGWLRVMVEDRGPGIPEGMHEAIFAPFATFGKSHGTGLGLAICRKIVGEHGGAIVAGDRAGGGAVFTVTLPTGR